MADIEKVIKGLEQCTSREFDGDKFGGVGKCGGCPYYRLGCTDRLKHDALVLLKEQAKLEKHLQQKNGNVMNDELKKFSSDELQ